MSNIITPLSNLDILNQHLPSAVAILECSKELAVLEANDGFFDLIGYNREEFLQKYRNCCCGIMRASSGEVELSSLLSHNTSLISAKIIKKNGEQCKIKISSKKITSQRGDDKIIVQIIDDSDSQIDEFAVLQSSNLDIHESFEVTATFTFDLDSKVFNCSQNFADKVGISSTVENFPNSLIEKGILRDETLVRFFNMDFQRRKSSNEKKLTFFSKNKVYFFNINFKVEINEKTNSKIMSGEIYQSGSSAQEMYNFTSQIGTDKLTGLLTKEAAEKKISSCLNNLFPGQICALLIVDIDNFSQINEQFGNLYGDAILSEFAMDLKKNFRDDDIIARAGGDEFFIFMRNLSSADIALDRAKLLCANLKREYIKDSIKTEITLSIGLSVSPEHGTTLEQLYHKADIALFEAKCDCSREYVKYHNSATLSKKPENAVSFIPQKNQKKFRDNKFEYIFRLLYTCDDLEDCLNSVLQLLTEHFNFSRGYIFEFSDDLSEHSCSYEWCKCGINPTKDKMQNLKTPSSHSSLAPGKDEEFFMVTNLEQLDSNSQSLAQKHDVKYILHFGVWDQNKPVGFIGFADCERSYNLMPDEIAEISVICRMIGVFWVKEKLREQLNKS